MLWLQKQNSIFSFNLLVHIIVFSSDFFLVLIFVLCVRKEVTHIVSLICLLAGGAAGGGGGWSSGGAQNNDYQQSYGGGPVRGGAGGYNNQRSTPYGQAGKWTRHESIATFPNHHTHCTNVLFHIKLKMK